LAGPESSWPPAIRDQLENDTRKYAAYGFSIVGKYYDDMPLISIDGWLSQEAPIREFRLYAAKEFLQATEVGKCLSGVFESDKEFGRAKEFNGRKVRIYATYSPTGMDEQEGGFSVIHNTCLGDVELHGKTFMLLE
jgi:hypothetical protein